MDGLIQHFNRRFFCEQRFGTSLDHGIPVAPISIHRESHNGHMRQVPLDHSGRLNAVQFWHVNVHQHDVGLKPTRQRDRFLAIRRLADDEELARLQRENAVLKYERDIV